MAHGINIDMTPEKFGGGQALEIDNMTIPLEYDDEKLFISISKPTEHDIKELEVFEITISDLTLSCK